MQHKNIVGKLINFRGMTYAPVQENGVIFLFAKLNQELGLNIETIRTGFPDCIARRNIGNDRYELINIEFEVYSSNFEEHGHLDSMKQGVKCDMIVCWEHDWKNCPPDIEVIELKEEYKKYKNEEIEESEKQSKRKTNNQYAVNDHLKKYPENIRDLFVKLDKKIKGISKDIWSKARQNPCVVYKSPERTFIYVTINKQELYIDVFTRGKDIPGLEKNDINAGGAKWRNFVIKEEKDLEKAENFIRMSYLLMKEAIKNKETVCWVAEIKGGKNADI